MTLVHKECDDPACECCNASRRVVDEWLETQKKKNKDHQKERVEESSLSVLLSCPFCDGTARTDDMLGWKVVCMDCGIATPDRYAKKVYAVDFWNKRAI